MEYVVTASDCDSKWSLGVMTLGTKAFSTDFALKATVCESCYSFMQIQ